MLNRQKYQFLFQPLVISFLSTALFFAIIFLCFRPGYAVDDDISIILLIAGYLGGKTLPFPVFSSVLLGFTLNPLYGIAPGINWEILFFIALNFFSVWALIHVFITRLQLPSLRIFATLAVLLFDAVFMISITFTTIAAFAALAGFCLVLTALQSQPAVKKNTLALGFVLVLASSLIRMEAMLLISLLSLPVLVILIHSSQVKRQVLAFALLGVLILSGPFFDRLYLNLSPAWDSYQTYNLVRSQLHDTPRKYNIASTYTRVSWSKNDMKLFFNWFFPDKKIYSLENLQYLVEHIPDKQISKVSAFTELLTHLFNLAYWPYLLIIFSTGLIISIFGLAKKAALSFLALLGLSFTLDFYLTWAMKIPDQVLISLLAGTAIFGLYIVTWASSDGTELLHQAHHNDKNALIWLISIVTIAIVFWLILNQSIESTKTHIEQQAAYRNVLGDLKNLRDTGKISTNALIISPANGFPFDWANPLTLDFPSSQVLEMGWLTFSPAYEKVLDTFGIQSIPEALYEKDNIYIMAEYTSVSEIIDYIKEHKGPAVSAVLIYQLSGTDTGLYQLHP